MRQVPILFEVLKPEPVTGADASKLVSDNGLKQVTRTIRGRFQHSSRPDVNVVQTAVVHFLRLLNRLCKTVSSKNMYVSKCSFNKPLRNVYMFLSHLITGLNNLSTNERDQMRLFVLVSFFSLRVLDKAEYSAFESMLNSSIVSYLLKRLTTLLESNTSINI